MSADKQPVDRMLGEATMHFAYREFQQAVKLLLEVVRLAPEMPHPYQTLGLIYEEMGQPLKALKLFMMAAHLSRRDAQQWRQLASLGGPALVGQKGIPGLQAEGAVGHRGPKEHQRLARGPWRARRLSELPWRLRG